jgi:cellulose synthase/poly-beta-1,6-N-acetylglucosamine synthase-like glycosyltransferase
VTGISFLVPVHNGEPWIREAIAAILTQADGWPFELLLIDDGSRDGSSKILSEFAAHPNVRVVAGSGRGAAAAINAGIQAAQHPLIAQVDQDVVVQPDWAGRLTAALDDSTVGAAQGYYVSAPDAGLFARVMNLDLQHRYARIGDSDSDHVCTGNSIYRADALQQVGLFDESLGYGYDNDISYRLRAAGYRLRIVQSARAVHRWREGVVEYLTQQYGFGYGRIDLIAKHPRRVGGDAVSPTAMMLHPIVLCLALMFGAVWIGAASLGYPASPWWMLCVVPIVALALERAAAGVAAAVRFSDTTALAFPVVHLLRDAAWVAAIIVWTSRRLLRRPLRPSDSMTPRAAYGVNRGDSAPAPNRPRA